MKKPDRTLAATLRIDDVLEAADMPADDRATCHTHQSGTRDRADHPTHSDPVGYVLRGVIAHRRRRP